jgi:hypothetical protein
MKSTIRSFVAACFAFGTLACAGPTEHLTRDEIFVHTRPLVRIRHSFPQSPQGVARVDPPVQSRRPGSALVATNPSPSR